MHVLLIHGSWHGAWCFDRVTPLFAQAGHRAHSLELPGSGKDAHNAPFITFKDLYESVFNVIDASKEPLVVVAHSFAGLIAAQVAELLHHKIEHVFYVAAWLPREGHSLVDCAKNYNNSKLPSIFIDGGDPRLKAIDQEGAKNLFYHDCEPKYANWAAAKLMPKPAQPDYEIMPHVEATHTKQKSTYVLCTNDRVVNPISQYDMATRFFGTEKIIVSLESGHSPFLSRPKQFFENITRR